jgi:hypothetical protein
VTRLLNRDRAAIAAALAAPIAAAAALLPFRASWPNTNVALLLVVVVVGVAALGNRLAGGLAAVGAAVWFDFFFTLPYGQFTIARAADITTFVLLLGVGLAVSQLAAWARRLKVITITDARYLALIHQTAALAQAPRAADLITGHVRDELTSLLDLRECRYEPGILLGHPPRLEPDGTIWTSGGRWDTETVGLPAGETELRVLSNGQYLGRFMLTPRPGSRPPLQARLVAATLADLTGRALGAASYAPSGR